MKTIDFTCPYCDHHQRQRFEQDERYQFKYCDDETGGCGMPVAFEVITVTIATPFAMVDAIGHNFKEYREESESRIRE